MPPHAPVDSPVRSLHDKIKSNKKLGTAYVRSVVGHEPMQIELFEGKIDCQ